MKKLLFILTLGFAFASASAAAVDWAMSVDQAFATKYDSANAYTYIVYGQESISTLINGWRTGWDNSDLLASAGAEGVAKQALSTSSGWNDFIDGYNGITGASASATQAANAYLVLIIAAGETDANAIYSYTTGLTFRDDTTTGGTAMNFSELGAADAEWNVTQPWTEVPVPEPTALALLALGVAGLALKRKVA